MVIAAGQNTEECSGPQVVRYADPARTTRVEELRQLANRLRRTFSRTTEPPATQVRSGPTLPTGNRRVVSASVDLQVSDTNAAHYTYFKIERRRWLVWEELNGGWLSRREGVQECRSEMLPGSASYRSVVDAYIVLDSTIGGDDVSDRNVWRSSGKVTHHYRYASSAVKLTRSDISLA